MEASLCHRSRGLFEPFLEGFGVFYWEGALLPVQGAGWADANSKCSWANQTFFTYDGKALPSLDLFSQIKE